MRGKRAGFLGGKESGLGQLPTLPAPHMHSQSRGWPSTWRGLRVSVFSHPGILGREGMSWDKTQGYPMVPAAFSGSTWAQGDRGQGRSSARRHHWAAPPRPQRCPSQRVGMILGWWGCFLSARASGPPSAGGWGILTGPVQTGGLPPRWRGPAHGLPAPGTQTLSEAAPHVCLCRATAAGIWVEPGCGCQMGPRHTRHP